MEIIGKQVLLKDENGDAIIPYVNMPMPHNVGDIFFTSRLDTELNGAVECNGGTYSTADFSGKQSIGNLLSGGSLPYVSLSEYASIVSANGSCRAFGWDGGTSFRVPTLKDVYIEAGTAETAGEFISESLPNITGEAVNVRFDTAYSASGCFYTTSENSGSGSGGGKDANLNFSASNSSSTYQDGAKVKPDSVRYRAMVQLANATSDEALITATSALQQISNKAEIDLSNVSTISSNTSSLISGLGKPSGKYVNLTLGESGTTYTAPANGWYSVNKSSTAASQWIYLLSSGVALMCRAVASSQEVACNVPVKKGEVVSVKYTTAGTTNHFRFVYDVGEN